MKIRKDFVTNSSSSSFIIASNKEAPEKYKNTCKIINKDNINEFLKDEIQYSYISNDDELLQKTANLSDEQMLLIKIAIDGDLDKYLELKKTIEETDGFLYYIFEDRDWLYDQTELNSFINQSKIIKKETDL